MTMATRSGNVFYPLRLRRGRARGHNHTKGHFLVCTRSVSNSSSVTKSSRSPSLVRSHHVQGIFSIKSQQTRNPLYHEDLETRKGHPSPKKIDEILFRKPS